MNPAWLGAIVGVATLLLGVIAWAIGLTFQAGRHSKSMEIAQSDIKELKTTVAGHAREISAWDQALRLLQEVREDVKSLMTGQIHPQRSRTPRRQDNDE